MSSQNDFMLHLTNIDLNNNHHEIAMQKEMNSWSTRAETSKSCIPMGNGNHLASSNFTSKLSMQEGPMKSCLKNGQAHLNGVSNRSTITEQIVNGGQHSISSPGFEIEYTIPRNLAPNSEVKINFQDSKALMRQLVLEKHEYNWKNIAKELGWTKQKAINYWQQEVYPEIKLDSKVAGALKWSLDEDSIMVGYIKKIGFNWKELVLFLPGRTLHSAEGRRRRLLKRHGVDEQYIHKLEGQFQEHMEYMDKHQFRKHIIKQIAKKTTSSSDGASNFVVFEDDC